MTKTTVVLFLSLSCVAPSVAVGGRIDALVQEQCDDGQQRCRTECTLAPGATRAAAGGSADVANGPAGVKGAAGALPTVCREVCEDVRNCSETAVRAK